MNKNDEIYADGSPELFDAASDLLMDKVMKTRKVKEQQIYDLALKALDYYREYLAQNQPYDKTTTTYQSMPKPIVVHFEPGKELVIPRNAITSWEVTDCNGIVHSKVEFLDRAFRTAQYESY